MTMHGSYITGGFFSLDGFHLTDLGYLLFANEYIKAINEAYERMLRRGASGEERSFVQKIGELRTGHAGRGRGQPASRGRNGGAHAL